MKSAKIYELYSPARDLYYIGSSRLPIETRINLHRSYKGTGLRSKKVTEDTGFTYKVLETLKKATKIYTLEKEGAYIKEYREKYGEKVVNKNIAGTTTNGKYPKDIMRDYLLSWKMNNPEKLEIYKSRRSQYNKKWYNKHKEELKAKRLTKSI